MSPAVLYGVLVGVRSEGEDREQGRLLGGRCMERRVVSLVFFKYQCEHESRGNLVKVQILT